MSIQTRVRVINMETCPICGRSIRRGEVCMPLYSNRRLVGYAHKRCSDLLDRANKIIHDVVGGI